METIQCCRPCAERLGEFRTVKAARIGRPIRDKITCEICDRRRYGYSVEVEWRDELEKTDEAYH